MFRRSDHTPVDDVHVQRLWGLYRALGLGFPLEARRLFGVAAGDDDPGPATPATQDEWCLRRLGRRVRCLKAAELSDHEFFNLPGTWEVIRVIVSSLTARPTRRGDLITVQGDMYCRPHGTWENIRIPFQHVWTLDRGRALLFENVLDATDLRPERQRPARAA
jgi:hypothetical protein